MKITKGSLWLGKEWKEAIELSLKNPDCGIEKVYKYKYPNRLLDTEKVFVGYQIFGYGNRRKYTTRIPKSLNSFVENILKLKPKGEEKKMKFYIESENGHDEKEVPDKPKEIQKSS